MNIGRRQLLKCGAFGLAGLLNQPLNAIDTSSATKWRKLFREMAIQRAKIVSYRCSLQLEMDANAERFPFYAKDHFQNGKFEILVEFARFGVSYHFHKTNSSGRTLAAVWKSGGDAYVFSPEQNFIGYARDRNLSELPNISSEFFAGDMLDPLAIGFGFLGDHYTGRTVEQLIGQHSDWQRLITPKFLEETSSHSIVRAGHVQFKIDHGRGDWITEYTYHSHRQGVTETYQWELELVQYDDLWLPKSADLVCTSNSITVLRRSFQFNWRGVNADFPTGRKAAENFAKQRQVKFFPR